MLYTLNEASYLTGRPASTINRTIDRGPVRAEIAFKDGRARRLLDLAVIRFLAVEADVHDDLSAAAKNRLYGMISRAQQPPTRIALGCVEIDLTAINERLARKISDLERLKGAVDETGPEPVLKRTDIPVHAVAALVASGGTSAAREAFPSLNHDQIDVATAFAAIYPKIGRPLPGRSLKSHLQDLAEAGTWDRDVATAAEEPEPAPLSV